MNQRHKSEVDPAMVAWFGNECMVTIGNLHRVNSYEDVFNIDGSSVISMIKVRVIQAMIKQNVHVWNG